MMRVLPNKTGPNLRPRPGGCLRPNEAKEAVSRRHTTQVDACSTKQIQLQTWHEERTLLLIYSEILLSLVLSYGKTRVLPKDQMNYVMKIREIS